MQPILEIKGISKKFRIRHEQQPYLSLRDSIASALSSPFGKGKTGSEDFWALKDISFDVYPGDSIGIIGKNGAGKSTLLKILSKITPPTEGKIISRGRIASLLEVGTGFHPELSGRENIFLNGSILGMQRKEIINKFDEIVDFSGVEKFLDTPLKHYSSGMQLRLAFAVAAFLEPEILVIDEVLAVGDAEFQKKCLGKMESISLKGGRTIIFVSHNLAYVQALCPRSIFLNSGQIHKFESTQNVVREYLHAGNRFNTLIDLRNISKRGDQSNDLSFESLKIGSKGNDQIYEDDIINIEITFNTNNEIKDLQIGFSLSDNLNNLLIENRSNENISLIDIEAGRFKATIDFNSYLKSGIYSLSIGARSSQTQLGYIPSLAQVEILPRQNTPILWEKTGGSINISAKWSLTKL